MIVRESVTNVLKHAEATTLDFQLHVRLGRLEMTIADDGRGCRPGPVSDEGHDGLANMQARATDLGGVVVVSSPAGRGTVVRVCVPLPAGAGGSYDASGREP